ncbi:MAG TPA: MFS transporter [Candidatus Binataceae bacterium]|nr:MFS transporter [Candidatus Binataceae bacterium]
MSAAASTPQFVSPAIRGIIRRYYTVWLGYSFANGFLFGVYPLFLRSRGLNQFEMNSVLATYFVVTFLTDVPTGAFADALGRRRSFILGCTLRASAFLLYFFAHHYLLFLLGESIDGVGTTFCNGAIDAWGVDSLDNAGFAGLKDRLFSRISQLTNLGFMASAVIGAYVADLNIAWPWLLGTAGYIGSALMSARLMDEPDRHGTRIEMNRISALVSRRVSDGLRQGIASRSLVLLSLANAIFFAAWAPYWLQWPQYVHDSFHSRIWIVGWVFSLFTVARMLGAEAIMHLRMDEGSRGTRLGLLIIAAAAMLFGAGAAGNRAYLVLIVLTAMNVCNGAMQPLMQGWLNEQIRGDERATLLSFNSTFATAGGSVGLLVNGTIADARGIATAWQFSAILSLAALPCYWVLRAHTPEPAPDLTQA